jgi:DNA-binding HxlR family transcriptional regulator
MAECKNMCYINDCPVTFAIRMIGGKWHLPVLWLLGKNPVVRYNELKRSLVGITNMMLSQTLKDLEGYSLICRKQYPEIPPRVEYSLAQAGLALMPAIEELAKWGEEQMVARSAEASQTE